MEIKKGKWTGKIIGIVLIFAFIGMMLGGMPAFVTKVEASPSIIYVPDDYSTIQAAVDAASPGNTIIVKDGIYTENVDVNKDNITIQSENGAEVTIVEAANQGFVFEFSGDTVIMDGLTVDGSIQLGWSHNSVLSNNIITGTIKVLASEDNLIINNIVSDNFNGIELYMSCNNVLHGNTVSFSSADGIELEESHYNILINNTVFNNYEGIELLGAQGNVLSDNLVYSNVQDGIHLTNGSVYNYLVNNTLLNTGSGIFLESNSNYNTLVSNIADSNDHQGIEVFMSNNNIIKNNTCRLNNIGISFWISNNNNVYLNNFIDNDGNAGYYDPLTNNNKWYSPQAITYNYDGGIYMSRLGNYWSDYEHRYPGAGEIGSTGRWDIPYDIDIAPDSDNYPLVDPLESYELEAPENQSPIASFTYSPYELTSVLERNPAVGESITFDASLSSDPDGGIISYIWNFDDIGSRTGVQAEVSYHEAGEYTVSLTVIDDDGAINNLTRTVTVVPEWRKELRIGDILFDSDPLGGLGHAGIYCGNGFTIEATGDPLAFLEPGVVMKSLASWDPKDINPNGRENVFLIRVHCSDETASDAVAFAQAQLGKDYWLSWTSKHYSTEESNWYCSELVWAAYYNQGIDIEYTPDNWAISPLEIYLEACLGEKSYIVSQHAEPPTIPTWGGLFILALCPVDIQVTDPNGLTVSTTSINIPGCIYMIDDTNDDGSPDDLIYIPERQIGEYLINVMPESGASPTDTYSLEVSAVGATIMLADNVQIGDIPGQGYIIRSTETEIEQITPTEGCFIATAAYGTPMAEEIQVLREFRNEYLLTNPLGQAFVDFYYKVSPPIAEFITEHPGLKPIVRAGLLPAVVMSTLVVNSTIAEKIAILGLLVLVSVAVAVWLIRRRSRGPEYT